MAYSSDIAKFVAGQLTRFTTYNRHQLAGQVANLDFWLDEVSHCLGVIDGYRERFERMALAQADYVARHKTVEFDLDDPCCTQGPPPPPRPVPDVELREASRQLCDATYRFLLHCLKAKLIDESIFVASCKQLDLEIDAMDLQRYA